MNNLSFAREEFKKYSVLVFGCEAEKIELKIDPVLSGERDEILIEVKNGAGVIAGSNKLSCLIAVYRFFRECGCRFLRPGSHGEVIKQMPLSDATVSLREKATSKKRCMKIEGAVSYEHVYNIIDFCPKIGLNSYEFQFKNSSVFFERWDVLIHKGHLPVWYDRLMTQKHNEENGNRVEATPGAGGDDGVQD